MFSKYLLHFHVVVPSYLCKKLFSTMYRARVPVCRFTRGRSLFCHLIVCQEPPTIRHRRPRYLTPSLRGPRVLKWAYMLEGKQGRLSDKGGVVGVDLGECGSNATDYGRFNAIIVLRALLQNQFRTTKKLDSKGVCRFGQVEVYTT